MRTGFIPEEDRPSGREELSVSPQGSQSRHTAAPTGTVNSTPVTSLASQPVIKYTSAAQGTTDFEFQWHPEVPPNFPHCSLAEPNTQLICSCYMTRTKAIP